MGGAMETRGGESGGEKYKDANSSGKDEDPLYATSKSKVSKKGKKKKKKATSDKKANWLH